VQKCLFVDGFKSEHMNKQFNNLTGPWIDWVLGE